jgi:hypothetical protein
MFVTTTVLPKPVCSDGRDNRTPVHHAGVMDSKTKMTKTRNHPAMLPVPMMVPTPSPPCAPHSQSGPPDRTWVVVMGGEGNGHIDGDGCDGGDGSDGGDVDDGGGGSTKRVPNTNTKIQRPRFEKKKETYARLM